MKRPIFIATIGYIIGIIWELYFEVSIALFLILSIILSIIVLNKKIFRYIKIFSKLNIIFILIIFIVIGKLYTCILNEKYENLYENINGKTEVIGTVVSRVKEKEYKNTYVINIESINCEEKYKNTKLYLDVNKEIFLNYGDKIKFIGEFKSPNKASNYKGFDYKNYLKTLKIYGIVKLNSEIKILKQNNRNFIELASNIVSDKIINISNSVLPKETSGLFLGILLGYTDYITDDVKEEFTDSGLAHMLAVSGSHITYIIICITFIATKAKLNKRKSKFIIIICLIFFMFLTGFSASVVRASIMGCVIMGAGIFYKKLDLITSISFSLLLILINNPFSITDIGLLLSFGGTIGIILFYKNFIIIVNSKNIYELITNFVKQMFYISISAQILIFPIILISFGTISFSFFVANIIAGSLLGIITILGFVSVLIYIVNMQIGELLFIIINLFLNLLILIAKICSKIPFAKIFVITPNIFL